MKEKGEKGYLRVLYNANAMQMHLPKWNGMKPKSLKA